MNIFKGFGGKDKYEAAQAESVEESSAEELRRLRDEEADIKREQREDTERFEKKYDKISNEKLDVEDVTPGARTTSTYGMVSPVVESRPSSRDIDRVSGADRPKRLQRLADRKFDRDTDRIRDMEAVRDDKKIAITNRRASIERSNFLERERGKKEIAFKHLEDKAKLQQRMQNERRYGPSQFGNNAFGRTLGGISQHRNYVQEQNDLKLRRQVTREGQLGRLEREQRGRGQQPSMGGFGASLSMGGQGMGSNMGLGQGMSLGPGPQQQRYDEYGQPVQKPAFDINAGLGFGGLSMGGNPFGGQQQSAPAPQQQEVRREYTPARQIRRAPQNETYAPGTGHESEPGAVYIREQESYGPKYTRVSPEEVMEGESMFKKVKTSYGYKYIKLRGRR